MNTTDIHLFLDFGRWRWSSFRWLVQGKRENEPLAVDDWDETIIDSPET